MLVGLAKMMHRALRAPLHLLHHGKRMLSAVEPEIPAPNARVMDWLSQRIESQMKELMSDSQQEAWKLLGDMLKQTLDMLGGTIVVLSRLSMLPSISLRHKLSALRSKSASTGAELVQNANLLSAITFGLQRVWETMKVSCMVIAFIALLPIILVVWAVKELVSQNADADGSMWTDKPRGIVSYMEWMKGGGEFLKDTMGVLDCSSDAWLDYMLE